MDSGVELFCVTEHEQQVTRKHKKTLAASALKSTEAAREEDDGICVR